MRDVLFKAYYFAFVLIALLQPGCFLNSKISSMSESSSKDLSQPSLSPLPEPSNARIENRYAKQVQVVWDAAVSPVTSYKISLSSSRTPKENCSDDITYSGSDIGSDFLNLTPATTYFYRICSSDGQSVSLGITGTFKTLKFAARAAAYPGYANWNDYLSKDGAKSYNGTGAACATPTGFNTCVNGGLIQKMVIPEVINCNRIKIQDSLSVFRWSCDTNATETIIYSTDVASFKGLSDLIANNQFRKNVVIVSVDGEKTYSSAVEVWWNNTIEPIPDSPTGVTTTLSNAGQTAGKIFVVSANKIANAYSITENNISIVTLKGAALIKDATTTSLISTVFGSRFHWLEGSFNGSNQATNLISFVSDTSRLHNIELAYAAQRVLTFSSSYGSSLTDFDIHHGTTGIRGASGQHNYISVSNGRFSNITGTTIDTLEYSVVSNVLFASNVGTNLIAYSANSIFSNISMVNNSTSYGVRGFYASHSLHHNFLSINSGSTLLYIYTGSYSTFSQIMSGGSNAPELLISYTQGAHKFTNNLVLENATECSIINDGSESPGLTTDGLCNNAGPNSNMTQRFGAFDFTKMFYGKVTTNDITNPNDTLGTSLFSGILDWIRFDNLFRSWGLDGNVFPHATNQGYCASGSCRIWDYRLKSDAANIAFNSTDTVIAKNTSFAPGATCPAAVHGNKSTTHDLLDNLGVPQTHTFLTNAVEIKGDGIGNDDFLCESSEACLYTPNFGYYQGEGDYEANGTCNFQNGTIANVKLYAYPINGVQ